MSSEALEAAAQTIRGAFWHGQGLGGHNNYRAAEDALAELLAALAVAREREQRAVAVGAVCDAFIDWMDSVGYNSIEAAEIVASCRAAATLAEPDQADGGNLASDPVRPGSASAAADDGRCPGCGWYVADCNCVAFPAADEPGETP